MNQNMIGRMAVIAAITLATTAIVMTLTQPAFAQSTPSLTGTITQSSTESASNTAGATDCTNAGTGPLTLLSITVCKGPDLSNCLQAGQAGAIGGTSATASASNSVTKC